MFRLNWKSFLVVCLLSSVLMSLAQQRTGSLHGQVSDELGALVVGATVTLIAADGTQKTAVTNNEGTYTFSSIAAWTIHAPCCLAGLYPTRKLNSIRCWSTNDIRHSAGHHSRKTGHHR